MKTDRHPDDIYFESIEENKSFISIPGMDGCHLLIGKSQGTTYDSPPHWHHALELVLIMEGSCRYIVNSAEHITTSGEMHLINSQHIHSALNGNPSGYIRSMVIEISDLYLKQMTADKPLYDFHIEKGSDAYRQIREDLYAIADVICQKDIFSGFAISYRLNHILWLLYTHCRTHESRRLEGYSKEVIRYVGEHYMEQITIDDVAQLVGLQKQYFCRCFHQETGLTFKYYLNRIRLDIALSLLATHKYSVMEAAIHRPRAQPPAQLVEWGCPPGAKPLHFRLKAVW